MDTKPDASPQIYRPVPPVVTPSTTQKFFWAITGMVLSPFYWLMATLYKTPGLSLHKEFAQFAIKLFAQRRVKISKGLIYTYIFWPMDSTRYFEFDFAWKALANTSIQHYLDVASPRLLPLLLLHKRPRIQADLLNPDTADLRVTSDLVDAMSLEPRCHLEASRIEDVHFPINTFDVITSISVIEHIPNDKNAVSILWELLKPGGKLIITVPCAAHSHVEYADFDAYNVQSTVPHGYIHLHYVYDQLLLEQRILSVTGQPTHFRIYGEKQAGWLRANLESKAAITRYPYWQEPYLMGCAFKTYSSIDELPGEGVICMEFTKPTS